jgi:hypothetical protein
MVPAGNWQGYLAYVQHPLIYPRLAPYNLGSSDAEGRHSLIVDRTERTVYVAARADAQTFLSQQWPKAEPATLTQEEWTALVKHLQRSRQDIDLEEIRRRIQEQYALVEALQEWLDRRLPI